MISPTEPTVILAPVDPTEPPADHTLLRHLVRFRWPLFILVGLVLLAGFNNHWRIGRDSSRYRAVAHSLVTGQGYTFRGQLEDHIYPGLPRMLATIETLFGPQDPLHPTASLLTMLILAGLSLLIIYHLVRLYFPLWIAVFVTVAVGLNRQFVEQAHELMTDTPFLLGACITLMGIGLFPRASTAPRRILAVFIMIGGGIIAASMRPTFWALLLPCIILCLAGMIRSRRRLWYAAGAAAAILLVVLWAMLDPRTNGFDPFAGRYEHKLIERLQDLAYINWFDKLLITCEKHFPIGIICLELIFPFGTLFFLNFLAWAVILMRKSPLWGLYIITTLLMTLLLGSKPRYYLMCLPFLLVAWALFIHRASLWASRWRQGPQWTLLVGLGIVLLPNLVRSIDFVLEQQGFTNTLVHKPFLEVFRDGDVLPVYQVSQSIRQHVPPEARVLGFEEAITSYLSGRPVFHPAEILLHSSGLEWRPRLRQLNPSYIVYGPAVRKAPLLNKLVDRKIVEIGHPIEVRKGIYLAPMHIPDGDPPTSARHRAKADWAARQPAPRHRRNIPGRSIHGEEQRPRATPSPQIPPTRPGRIRSTTAPTTRPAPLHPRRTKPTIPPPTRQAHPAKRLRPTTMPTRQQVLRRIKRILSNTLPLARPAPLSKRPPRAIRKRPSTRPANSAIHFPAISIPPPPTIGRALPARYTLPVYFRSNWLIIKPFAELHRAESVS